MDTGQSNETEAFENIEQTDNNLESKKDDNENQPKPSASIEVTESGADLMKKINEEAEKLNPIIDKNEIKVFSKYEDLNEEELQKLLDEKTQNIIKLNTQKEEAKNNLSSLLNQINKTITDNYQILYKEKPDPEIMFELHKEIEFKKKEFQVSKNMNNSVKTQFASVNDKFNKKSENGKSIEENTLLLNNLKTENKKLQISIRKYKDNLNFGNRDEKNEHKTDDFPNIVKTKTDEIRNLTLQKHEYLNKIKNSIKSLENVKKEIKHLEDILKKQEEKDKNEKLNSKINFWMNLINGDLVGNSDEIISKIIKNESNFIKEINKNETKNKNLKKKIINKSPSYDEASNENGSNSNMSFRETNIPYINSSNMNRKSNNNLFESKSSRKGIFSKFNYFKQKPHSSSLNKIKSNNEEIKINQYKETNEDLNLNPDEIIKQDYEETTENEYQQLLEKKSQYLETNVRLERNIGEIKRTKKAKISNVYNTVQQNNKKLEDLKEQNNLLENEIQRLQSLFLLTIDKEKLKMEIKEKNKKNKLDNIKNRYNEKQMIKLDSSLATENNILNELKESNDSTIMKNMINENKKKKNKNKNKSGYVDELSPEKNITETREQRLEKIRKKYLYDNPNDEICELNTNEEQTKETNLLNDNLIIENDVNKEEKINEDKNDDEDKVN
jgi:hypothetical protein